MILMSWACIFDGLFCRAEYYWNVVQAGKTMKEIADEQGGLKEHSVYRKRLTL